MKSRIKAVIFDLDNTLYDETAYIARGFKKVSEKVGKDYQLRSKDVNGIYRGLIDAYKGNRRNRIFNSVLEEKMANISSMEINQYIENELLLFYKMVPRKLKLYPEAKRLLTNIKKKKIKLGLITQGHPVNQLNKLFLLDIADMFDAIEISGNYKSTLAKPHPFMFKKMLNRLNVSPQEAIYIGDNLLLDKGATKAGIKFYYLPSSKNNGSISSKDIKTIHSLKEVAKAL